MISSAFNLAPLLLLLGVRDPSRLCLTLLHFTKVHPNSSGPEGVRLRRAAVLLVGGPKPSDEGVEAAPRLPERAGAGRRRVGLPEEDAAVQVNLSLPELVEVPKEFKHVVEVTLRK